MVMGLLLGRPRARPRRSPLRGSRRDRAGNQHRIAHHHHTLHRTDPVFPQTWVQTCIVHLIRSSLRYVNYRDKRSVAKALKPIYTAPKRRPGRSPSSTPSTSSGAPAIPPRSPPGAARGRTSRRSWRCPASCAKAVYTTNTIEAMHRQVRKAIKTRGHFPDEQAATKLIYLAIHRAEARWSKNRAWTSARAGLKIHFGDRFPG